MDGSAKRIYEAALGAPEGHSVILLAHNGPTGVPLYPNLPVFIYEKLLSS